jgi:hypothetical protein
MAISIYLSFFLPPWTTQRRTMHWWSTTSSRHNTTYLRYVRLPRPFKASIHHYKPVTHKCQASPKMLFRTAEFQCSCSRLIRLAQQPHDSCLLHYTNRRHEYSSWKQEQFRHNSWAPTCESPIVAMTPCGLVGDTMASAPSPRCRNDTKNLELQGWEVLIWIWLHRICANRTRD